jgi:uncharacterized membrane protein
MNHHYLMRFVGPPTLRLMWINFVHLFMVSFLPFATAWVARTRLASSPVAFYAGVFVCIDIAYNVFERDILKSVDATQMSARTRRIARRRSLIVLASFTTAMLVAIVAPRLGFGLICGALILHLRPGVTWKSAAEVNSTLRSGSRVVPQKSNPDQVSQIDDDIANRL